LLLASRYPLAARQVIPLLLFGLLALMARRNVIWFCFVAAPVLAASMSLLAGERWAQLHRRAARPSTAVWRCCWRYSRFLPCPGCVPTSLRQDQSQPGGRRHAIEAVAALCQMPEAQRVFNEQGYGVYMTWACPQKPVFIDTRLGALSDGAVVRLPCHLRRALRLAATPG
jgi:hypothetical protein